MDEPRADNPTGGEETVWIAARLLLDVRVQVYHWSRRCHRALNRGALVQVPRSIADSNPTLRPCPECRPTLAPDS